MLEDENSLVISRIVLWTWGSPCIQYKWDPELIKITSQYVSATASAAINNCKGKDF